MFKPLLRTMPSLSGNVKILCRVKPDNDISTSLMRDDAPVCHVVSASLLPVSETAVSSPVRVNLLSSTYDCDIKEYYAKYADIFYSSTYKYDKYEVERIDMTRPATERDKSFEFGCARARMSVSPSQFEFFAPVYIDSIADIPDSFVINVSIDNGIYKVKDKTITVKIKDTILKSDGTPAGASAASSEILQLNTNMLYDYIYRYIKGMGDDRRKCVMFNYSEDSADPAISNAVYYGADLKRGGFSKAVDSPVNFLYYNGITINSFDDTVNAGFSRHKMVVKQIMPLCFAFDLSDMLTAAELRLAAFGRARFSGHYLTASGETADLFDFSINYNELKSPADSFDKSSCAYSYKVTGASDNIMGQLFPALNERMFWKYRFMNKISPNTCRWAIASSIPGVTTAKIKYPYIINNNVAFSLSSGSSYKYWLYPYSDYSATGVICDKAVIDDAGMFWPHSKLYESGDWQNKINVIKTLYNFVLPTNNVLKETENGDIYYYDYYRYNDNASLLGAFNNYITAIKSIKYAFSNILYITDSYYSEKTETGARIIDYIGDPNVEISLSDIINGNGVFNKAELSLSRYGAGGMFDTESDKYAESWSSLYEDTACVNGIMYNLNHLYNNVEHTIKNEQKYSEALFDAESESAVNARNVAAKNGIQEYFGDNSLVNFNKTRRITKFGVFTLPVMSVVTDESKLITAASPIKYNDNSAFTGVTAMTYANNFEPVLKTAQATSSDASLMRYRQDKIATAAYNASFTDAGLLVKSDMTLGSILGNPDNTAYTVTYNDGVKKTVHTVSYNFIYNKSYNNIYVNLSDITKANTYISDLFNLSFNKSNIYYSYNEVESAYKNITIDEKIRTKLGDLLQLDTFEAYSFVNIRNIGKITSGESNALAYEWTEYIEKDKSRSGAETISAPLSYICAEQIKYGSDTYTGDYNNIYIETETSASGLAKHRVFINGARSYSEATSTGFYNTALYNKERFINTNKYSNSIYNVYKEIIGDTITEYALHPVVKTDTGAVINTNVMAPADSASSFTGPAIYTGDVKYDTNVILCDIYNMKSVLQKFGLLQSNISDEAAAAKISEWRGSGAARDFFCFFISAAHVDKWLNNICGGFSNELMLYPLLEKETDEDMETNGGTYRNDIYDTHYINAQNNNGVTKNTSFYSAWPIVDYTTDDGAIEGVGGPFYNMYAVEKAAVVDENVCIRPKYKYTRLYKYIYNKISEKLEDNFPGLMIGSDKIDVYKTAKIALRNITASSFGGSIVKKPADLLFDITLEIDIYSAISRIVIKSGYAITIENVALAYRKCFIRVNEDIMETVFKLSNNSKDENNIIDLYFSRPISDTEYDRAVNNVQSLKYDVISEKEYFSYINKYKEYTTDKYDNIYINSDYGDIIYKSSDCDNLTPLYNDALFENKTVSKVYTSMNTGLIKKCDAYYKNPFTGAEKQVNYRYNMSAFSEIVNVNDCFINKLLNIYNKYDSETYLSDWDKLYTEHIKPAVENAAIYKQYNSTEQVSLLAPVAGSEFDELGLASQNMFTYTSNGENYGFYIIGIKLNNTNQFFDITCVNDINIEAEDGAEPEYVFSSSNENNNIFHSFNNVPLINVDKTTGEFSVSIYGVQNFISSFAAIVPMLSGTNILNTLFNIKTIEKPKQMNVNIKYLYHSVTDNAAAEEKDILYIKKSGVNSDKYAKTLKTHILTRYWSWAVPYMRKVTDIMSAGEFNYIYNTKRKIGDKPLIDSGKYITLGDTVIDQELAASSPTASLYGTVNDINDYHGINIYGDATNNASDIKPYNNIIINNYKEPEYKHFNTSTLFILPASFAFSDNVKYIYTDIVSMSKENVKKQVFKQYVVNYIETKYEGARVSIENIISDTDILFLYGRYSASTMSKPCGVNDAGERLYTLTYKYALL